MLRPSPLISEPLIQAEKAWGTIDDGIPWNRDKSSQGQAPTPLPPAQSSFIMGSSRLAFASRKLVFDANLMCSTLDACKVWLLILT